MMLNDADYLKNIISATITLVEATTNQPTMIGIKNAQSEYLYISPYFLKQTATNFNPQNASISLWKNYPFNLVREDELKIIQLRTPMQFLVIDYFAGKLSPRVFIKTPLINPKTNNVVGIICQSIAYHQFNFKHYFNQVLSHRQQQNCSNNLLIPTLSERQKQIVFFFLNNLSSQEIANFINKIIKRQIKKTTIDSIFSEQLYPKFNVSNRTDLKQALVDLGFHLIIPENLLHPIVYKYHIPTENNNEQS